MNPLHLVGSHGKKGTIKKTPRVKKQPVFGAHSAAHKTKTRKGR